MKQYHPGASTTRLCRLFGFSRQAYYKTQSTKENISLEHALILEKVKQVRTSMPKIGALKLHYMLRPDLSGHHIHIGRDSFCSLLRDNDLMVKRSRKYKVRTTNSRHPYYKWPDLTPGLLLSAPGQLWVSDITYLRTREDGFLYLSLITDAFSRRIVGHHLSHSLSARGCVSALNKAIAQLPRPMRFPLIHHSDRGIQYCCNQYVPVLLKEGISISMTQNGSPYENALAERVNGILKTELGLGDAMEDYRSALRAVSSAIDTYNRLRPHLSLAMLTPEQVHQSTPSFPIQPINPKQSRSKKSNLSTSDSTIVNNCQPLTV
jgi:putative transposase